MKQTRESQGRRRKPQEAQARNSDMDGEWPCDGLLMPWRKLMTGCCRIWKCLCHAFVLAKAGRRWAYQSPVGTQMNVLRIISHMSLGFTGEARSRHNSTGAGRVLHPYGTGKSRPGGAGFRKEDALHELSPDSTAVTRGAEDEWESAKESENANKDERKTERSQETEQVSEGTVHIKHRNSALKSSNRVLFYSRSSWNPKMKKKKQRCGFHLMWKIRQRPYELVFLFSITDHSKTWVLKTTCHGSAHDSGGSLVWTLLDGFGLNQTGWMLSTLLLTAVSGVTHNTRSSLHMDSCSSRWVSPDLFIGWGSKGRKKISPKYKHFLSLCLCHIYFCPVGQPSHMIKLGHTVEDLPKLGCMEVWTELVPLL